MASTELDVVKISQLPAASSVNTTDVFPVSSSGATYKMSYDVLKDQMEEDISDILDSAVSAATTSATNSANAASQSAQSAAASATAANDWASNLTIDAVPTDGSTNPVQSDGVYDELTELKNDLETITDTEIINYTSGGYITLSGNTVDINNVRPNSAWRCAVVPCASGDIFTINGTGGVNPKAWGFADSNNNLLSMAPNNASYTNEVITAPENSAYLVLNDNNTGGRSYKGVGFEVLNASIVDLKNFSLTTNGLFAALIESGEDLNAYRTIGNYRISSSTVAREIANVPINLAGMLIVCGLTGNSGLLQIYLSVDGSIYNRAYRSNAWQPWDNIVYLSHINDEVTAINRRIDFWDTIVTAENYVDENAWIRGKYINANNGVVVDANRYMYQYAPILSSGVYSTIRKYLSFGTAAAMISLHDINKQYIKTIIPDNYDQTTGVLVFTITDDDIRTARYVGISKMDVDYTNMVKSAEYNDSKFLPYGYAVDRVKSNLHNKILVCDGDSICAGFSDRPLLLNGWYGRLKATNAMTGKNYGVSGGTITYLTEDTHCISRSIDVIASEYTNIDYLILEGGTNDADRIGDPTSAINFGAWTENDYNGNYNDTTFCGAVESLFYKALINFPSAKIGFIIPMEMGGTNIRQSVINNRRLYFDEITKIATKWHIPILDLWKTSGIDARLTAFYDTSISNDDNVTAGKYYYDGQHPTSAGYNHFQNKIQQWANTL